jgi:hypothetical protein
MHTKTWTREQIDTLLRSNPKAVERAIVRLYERQTQDERYDSRTKHDNARGFSSAFASRGSYYARWVQGGRNLTGRHYESALRIALTHSKQLVEIANGRP